MRWKIDGTYLENCNCDMVCPCSASAPTLPADKDRCNAALAFHVRRGEIKGIDVGGLNDFVVPIRLR
ncbi:DUF1326 domain-containing protein [Arthrobacter sp. AL12]|uniref:DUF1326 domain-containing protein n=1 Tax=Arthrobacter sp. AL12 TaxID=3042241 RepID=UPI002499C1BC|nr:DUF1326 domain-containing protein [Arthrobacter sp. AL12]MDI3211619.1 DUF1326 domain-containing protein [Arthrobacter sp. AL12]